MNPRAAHSVSATTVSVSNYAGSGAPPATDEKILVSRQHLEQLQRHIRLDYERFPTRHLRQSLLIIDHILARR
ncbi:hypothetical protein [Roseiflexus sp.]|uniref:hypothetical protein n=1 Tax=Roseiflexus sp. TaxID=2562120 RepID=UPI0021DDE60C|nr:hypothetical protein [Roseiflexus sp.]GIW01526.1 MAG: hypothetical protein KatS3mg058_2929 [Roseiflexus sp.]